MHILPAFKYEFNLDTINDESSKMTSEEAIRVLEELSKNSLGKDTPTELLITNKEVIAVTSSWLMIARIQQENLRSGEMIPINDELIAIPKSNFMSAFAGINLSALCSTLTMFTMNQKDEPGRRAFVTRPDFPQLFTVIFWDLMRWHANNIIDQKISQFMNQMDETHTAHQDAETTTQ